MNENNEKFKRHRFNVVYNDGSSQNITANRFYLEDDIFWFKNSLDETLAAYPKNKVKGIKKICTLI